MNKKQSIDLTDILMPFRVSFNRTYPYIVGRSLRGFELSRTHAMSISLSTQEFEIKYFRKEGNVELSLMIKCENCFSND